MKRVIIAAVALTATTFTYAQTTVKASEAPSTPVETPAPAKAAPATKEAPAQAAQIEGAAAIDTAAATEKAADRKPVKISDLPAPVQKALGNTEYTGWTPSVAYWITGETKDHYEITLVRGDESNVVKYNAEGSKLD